MSDRLAQIWAQLLAFYKIQVGRPNKDEVISASYWGLCQRGPHTSVSRMRQPTEIFEIWWIKFENQLTS